LAFDSDANIKKPAGYSRIISKLLPTLQILRSKCSLSDVATASLNRFDIRSLPMFLMALFPLKSVIAFGGTPPKSCGDKQIVRAGPVPLGHRSLPSSTEPAVCFGLIGYYP